MFESSRFLPTSRLVATARRQFMGSMDCASITAEGVLRAGYIVGYPKAGKGPTKVSYSGMIIDADMLSAIRICCPFIVNRRPTLATPLLEPKWPMQRALVAFPSFPSASNHMPSKPTCLLKNCPLFIGLWQIQRARCWLPIHTDLGLHCRVGQQAF